MIPIEKNIFVVDEQGNTYEATYPKRAKGLVKSGRARFIDENTICLACPPNVKLEDKTMSENMINEVVEQRTESRFTIEYALERMEEISRDQTYLMEALAQLSNLESKGPGDVGAEGRAHAIAEVVSARERTNQMLIETYRQMYKYLRPDKPLADSERVMFIKYLIGVLADKKMPVESKDALKDILTVALQDLSRNF